MNHNAHHQWTIANTRRGGVVPFPGPAVADGRTLIVAGLRLFTYATSAEARGAVQVWHHLTLERRMPVITDAGEVRVMTEQDQHELVQRAMAAHQ